MSFFLGMGRFRNNNSISASQLFPLRTAAIDIHPNARWQQNGITVAGKNADGNGINQLSFPLDLFVDDEQTIYVAYTGNHRIMEWKWGATGGQVVADGNEQGREENGLTQLSYPQGVVVDQLGTVYVADDGNNRIMRWPKGARQESVIVGGHGEGGQSNQLNRPIGLSFDRHGNLYAVDCGNHQVQKFNIE
ncbi:unnamed protein product [Rotaria sp. Silwood1]|nr:unnamed protein product [Rotaria sp. Silwood1]CAF1640937.1 unnamed protein product [Rotaria sp. Silwood1]CAF3764117.1 unnamed protein product [Rotaria sp. Silwood1]CAF3812748.1 unnamed protein product [Rotaria sp. Silwood1]CAF3825237.1 unnamed protein product [Rotaria sp. Silwood1]